MIISSLKLRNFMNIAATDLQFQQGINVLAGKNGQGKSAVLEAIAFCLLGRRRGDSWKDYIKSKTDSFLIELTIIHNNERILFKYVGEQNKMALSRTIITTQQTYINSECDAFLEMNFDSEMLENVLFTMQDSPSIASMTSGERRAIFKKVFNTDFVEALERLKEDQESLVFSKMSLQSEVKVLEAKQYHFPEGRIEIVDEDQIGNLYMRLANFEQLREDYIRSITQAKEERSNIKKAKDKAYQGLLAAQERLKGAEWLYKSANTDTAIKELESLEKELADKASRFETIEAEYNLAKNKLSVLENPIAEKDAAKKKVQDLSAHKRLLLAQIETSKKGICDECGQSCSTNHLEELQESLIPLQAELDEAQKSFDSYKKLCDEYKALDDGILIKEVLLNQAKEKVSSLQSSVTYQKERIDREFLLVVKLSADVTKAKEELAERVAEYNAQEALLNSHPEISEVFPMQDKIDACKEEISALEALQQINSEKLRLTAMIKKEQQFDKDRLQELMVKLNDLEQEEKDLSMVRQIFEVTLPNYINQKACDILQAYMATFLSNTKDEFLVQLQQSRKGIDFLYKANRESDWLQAKLASGYESALLTLAFKCAVASAYKAKMLILDEPDKAATESASALLFQTITEDLKTGFEQIFIITHRNNSLEYLQENGALIYKVHQGVFEQYVL